MNGTMISFSYPFMQQRLKKRHKIYYCIINQIFQCKSANVINNIFSL